MIWGKSFRIVLVLVLVVALGEVVYGDGCCFLDYVDYSLACYEGDESECTEDQGEFFDGYDCELDFVEKCIGGCCCGVSPDDPYPIRKGTCQTLSNGLFLGFIDNLQDCDAICDQDPLCSESCEPNNQDCFGIGKEINAGEYYCWDLNQTYLVRSDCLIDCDIAETCDDGMKNQDEIDIDCGGSCPRCSDGKSCLSRHDCASDFCNAIDECGCIDYDSDGKQDIRCGGDDCNDNDGSTVKCPVLLVHGYMVVDPNGTWYVMKDWLENDGFDAYYIDLEPWILPANGDITDYAGELDDEIAMILENTKAAKIDIVAHSMGGLVSRWYSRFGYKGNIRNIIMLGTPNHGSELFYGKYALSILSKFLVKLKVIDKIADFVLGDAGRQMTPYSLFLNMLNHDNPLKIWGTDILTVDIGHHTMAGTKAIWFLPINSLILFGEDDGVVRVESVKLDGFDSHEEYYMTHSQLTKNSTLYNDVKGILETPGLVLGLGILDLPQDEVLSRTQEAFYIDDNIQQDFKIYNLTISYSNVSVFLLSWYNEESVLGLNLIMPNGTLINESIESINAIYYPANITENDTIEGFVVDEPMDGVWQAKVIFKEGVKTNYTFMVWLDTDLRILISTDKPNYGLNEPINLSVNLTNFGESVLGSDVRASVKRPDGVIGNLILYDDGTNGDNQAGDGSYFNIYYGTDLLGIYEITVMANGTIDSTDYYRQKTIQTEVYEPIDLYLNESGIYFSNSTPIEGDEIEISALIYNEGNVDLENITVEFYNDDPMHYGELIGQDVINVSANSFSNATVLWSASPDTRYVFVLISPFNFLEEDYSNNLANKSIDVEAKILHEFDINLIQGWNLVSIPLEPKNNIVTKVFEDINYSKIFSYYQNSWLELGNNSKISETRGLWINSLNNQTFTIEGEEFTYPINFSLIGGWNLISYPSLNMTLVNESLKDVNYSIVYGYNGSWSGYSPFRVDNVNSLNYFVPGYGYWVKVISNTT